MSQPCRCAVIDGFDAAAFVSATLAEDMGAGGDITSAAVIPANARLTAVMEGGKVARSLFLQPIIASTLPSKWKRNWQMDFLPSK